MLRNVLHFHHKALEALEAGVDVKAIVALPIREKISRMRFIPPDRLDEIKGIHDEIDAAFETLMKKGGEQA
jgi:V/A-type H+-transporting ATPase subunit A